ncbi:hypothetical protein QQ045_005022 [Rhodiola kirilowii]
MEQEPEIMPQHEVSASSPDAILEEQEIMPQQEVLPVNSSSLEISSTRVNDSGIPPASVNPKCHLRLQLGLIGVQVFAAILVLLLTRHEGQTTFLRGSIIMYATACVAALPIVFWGYDNLDQPRGNATDLLNLLFQRNIQFESFLYFFLEDSPPRPDHSESLSTKQVIMVLLRIILNLGFGVWLVTGVERIFTKERSSPTYAPILYSLNIVYFIYTGTVHVLGVIVLPVLTIRRAQKKLSEMINSLPLHIFTTGGNGGGVVAQDSGNQRVISENEAVCAICLAAYDDDNELRELPCSHLLHKECVDRWLRIKARCPLCSRVI